MSVVAGVQEKNCLHRATRNGVWLSAVPHHINGMDLSWEELRDNHRLSNGLMPQGIFATCDGCVKKLSIEISLSFPKGGLVLKRHDDAAKDWGSLGAWALVPSDITYEPKINSSTVQGNRTGAGAQQEGGTADDGADIVRESQGVSGQTVNGSDRLMGIPGLLEVLAESRADISTNRF